MAAWTWRFENGEGTEVQPAVQPEEFTTQGDAESWVGEYWKELLDGGVEQVRLFEDATEIYGPMGLRSAEAAPVDEAADEAGAADSSDAAGEA